MIRSQRDHEVTTDDDQQEEINPEQQKAKEKKKEKKKKKKAKVTSANMNTATDKIEETATDKRGQRQKKESKSKKKVQEKSNNNQSQKNPFTQSSTDPKPKPKPKKLSKQKLQESLLTTETASKTKHNRAKNQPKKAHLNQYCYDLDMTNNHTGDSTTITSQSSSVVSTPTIQSALTSIISSSSSSSLSSSLSSQSISSKSLSLTSFARKSILTLKQQQDTQIEPNQQQSNNQKKASLLQVPSTRPLPTTFDLHLLQSHHQEHRMKHYFSIWQRYYIQHQRYPKALNLLSKVYMNYQVRICFSTWPGYQQLQRLKQHQQQHLLKSNLSVPAPPPPPPPPLPSLPPPPSSLSSIPSDTQQKKKISIVATSLDNIFPSTTTDNHNGLLSILPTTTTTTTKLSSSSTQPWERRYQQLTQPQLYTTTANNYDNDDNNNNNNNKDEKDLIKSKRKKSATILDYQKSFLRKLPSTLGELAYQLGYLINYPDMIGLLQLKTWLRWILQIWRDYINHSKLLRVQSIQLRNKKRLQLLFFTMRKWIVSTPAVSYRMVTWIQRVQDEREESWRYL
jgi:hypothetical protein